MTGAPTKNLKITLWGINYAPEVTGIAVYNTGLCEFLADQGHEVTVVTAFPYYPSWQLPKVYRKSLFKETLVNGLVVHRCWLFVPKSPSVPLRILHEASFVLTSFLRQAFLPASDLYIVVSPPLLLGLAAWLLSLMKGRPYLFHVQDMQPDAAISLNMLRSRLLFQILRLIEWWSYRQAQAVSVISPDAFHNLLVKGVAKNKILLFPNWAEIPDMAGLPQDETFKRKRGINPHLSIVSYSGNIGVKQGVELIIEAARIMNGSHQVLFVIAGDGSRKPFVEELAKGYRLSNVRFEGVLPENEHTELLVDSDICLIPLKTGTEAAFLPSKLLKILALGRPVVTNADQGSALYRATAEGQFGALADSGNAESLAETIRELISDKKRRRQMGRLGRAYVEQFSKMHVLPAFEATLKERFLSKP